MIHETHTTMLRLLADALHSRTPEKIPAGEWPALFQELKAQMVYALPGEYRNHLGLNEAESADYMVNVIRNRQIFHKLMREQTRVLSLLEAESILVVVLKGAAAASSYVRPENRSMGDIDLLVLPEDFDRAYQLLLNSGCALLDPSATYNRHVEMYAKAGIDIELHRYFSSSDNDDQNRALDEMLFRAIPRRVSSELCHYPLPMLPPLENGIVLLSHINHHISGGLGLRQIIDWMTYVEKYLDDDLWNNGFAEAAEKIGLKTLAIITTAMCRKYLGLEKDIHWCPYDPLCDKLMEYILARGNFGRRDRSTERSAMFVLKQFRNPFQGFAMAQRNGLVNWEATKKHPVLRPFAWCYQFGRWARKGLAGGIKPTQLGDVKSAANEEAEMIEKLGITRH